MSYSSWSFLRCTYPDTRINTEPQILLNPELEPANPDRVPGWWACLDSRSQNLGNTLGRNALVSCCCRSNTMVPGTLEIGRWKRKRVVQYDMGSTTGTLVQPSNIKKAPGLYATARSASDRGFRASVLHVRAESTPIVQQYVTTQDRGIRIVLGRITDRGRRPHPIQYLHWVIGGSVK